MLVLVVKVSLELWSRIKRGMIYSVAALWALSQHIWFENNQSDPRLQYKIWWWVKWQWLQPSIIYSLWSQLYYTPSHQTGQSLSLRSWLCAWWPHRADCRCRAGSTLVSSNVMLSLHWNKRPWTNTEVNMLQVLKSPDLCQYCCICLR